MLRPLLVVAAVLALVAVACGGDGDSSASDAPTAATPTLAAPTPCSPARPQTPGASTKTISSDGTARRYLLNIPPGYVGTQPVPLVIAFHGFGTNGEFIAAVSGLGAATDARGWIAVFPDGAGTPPGWNAYATGVREDDTQFVSDLLADLEAALCIDPRRIYAAGHSNGGGMALRAACDLPGRFAAVAPIAATWISCEGGVPLIAFHGAGDAVVPYEGGISSLGTVYPPVHRAASEWARTLGCDGLPTISRPAGAVELSSYNRCTGGGADALLYTVIDGGHTWPDAAVDVPADLVGFTTHAISANELMLDFFEAHAR